MGHTILRQNEVDMSSLSPSESASRAKKALRAEAIARRSHSQVDSSALCRHLELFLSSVRGVVVVYDSLDGEVDLNSLWHPESSAQHPNISFAITRTPEVGKDLTIHLVTVEMERHRWGYHQPVPGSPEVVYSDIAAVLVPGLAFDLAGGRIGWGAGYYDRLLSKLGNDVLKIGISDGFIVDEVPREAHDVAMTHIATASGIVTV